MRVAAIATWQLKRKYNVDCEARSMGTKRLRVRHKFKWFFHDWQEKTASFSRYFQAVANWIWKGVSVTVVALLYNRRARSIASRHFDVCCLYQYFSCIYCQYYNFNVSKHKNTMSDQIWQMTVLTSMCSDICRITRKNCPLCITATALQWVAVV